MVSAQANSSPNSSGVLMVEGQDDKHMVWQLCAQYPSLFSIKRSGYELFVTLLLGFNTFRITEQGSRPELIKSIRQQVVTSNSQAVGILVDADDSSTRCWHDLAAGFNRTGVQLPTLPSSGGTIIPEQGFRPRIGIWIMPDNSSRGELEDFVKGMIPGNDSVWRLSEQYIDNIPQPNRKFVNRKTDKAKVYAWLAARKEPGRVGAAIGAGDLNANNQPCLEFVSWISTLFG